MFAENATPMVADRAIEKHMKYLVWACSFEDRTYPME